MTVTCGYDECLTSIIQVCLCPRNFSNCNQLITRSKWENDRKNLPCAGDNEQADGRRRWQRQQRRWQLERGRKALKNSWKLQLRLINHWYSTGAPKRNPRTAASESGKSVSKRRPAGKRCDNLRFCYLDICFCLFHFSFRILFF